MNCIEYRKLVNREVDGRTSPEEEAMLMQHIGSCPSCAHEQRIQHRIHQALKSAPSPVAPAGLPARIADAVLAGESSRGTVIPFTGRISMARAFKAAAVVLLTVGLGGLSGWFVGGDSRPVQADPNPDFKVGVLEADGWRELGLPQDAILEVAKIKAKFESQRRNLVDKARAIEIHNLETKELLEVIGRHAQVLERYRESNNLTPDDIESLRTRGHR